MAATPSPARALPAFASEGAHAPIALASIYPARPSCFARAAAWSPDGGSHVLLQRDNHSVSVYRVRQAPVDASLHFELECEVASPSPLLTAQWYPFAYGGGSPDDASWMLLVSARDTPLRLVDARSGVTRYAYALPSHTETLLAAYSALIAPAPALHHASCGAMALLYAGLDNATLAILDVTRPTPRAAGRVSLGLRAGHAALTRTRARAQASSPANASKALGQRGIVTCLTLIPHGLDEESAELLAVGTSDGSVGLYDTAALRILARVDSVHEWDPQKVQTLESLGLNACVSAWRAGLSAAHQTDETDEKPESVSQITLLTTSPYLVAVAQRRFPGRVLIYDLRYVRRHDAPAVAAFPYLSGPAYMSRVRAMVQQCGPDFETYAPSTALVAVLQAPKSSEPLDAGPTNQRIMFSVNNQGAWLASGAQSDGRVHLWDVSEDTLLDRSADLIHPPTVSFHAHDDVVSSCAFHPYYPMLLTTSGARHFGAVADDGTDDSNSSDSDGSVQKANPEPASLSPERHPVTTCACMSDLPLASSPSLAPSNLTRESSRSSSTSDYSTGSSLTDSGSGFERDEIKIFTRDASVKLWDLR